MLMMNPRRTIVNHSISLGIYCTLPAVVMQFAADIICCVTSNRWTDYVPKDIPAQNNGCDCGVFTSKFADFMSDGRTVYEFEQRYTTLYMIISLHCKAFMMLSI
jgi:hypothetical protein